jgi:hypothetical protein
MLNRFTVFLLMGGAFLSYSQSSFASIVPQAGANPIPINQTSITDNVQVLLATLAERTSDIQVVNPTEGRKNFNIDNFLTAADYLAWTITVPTGANYQPTALMSANNGQHLSLSVNGSAATSFTADGQWDRLVGGTVFLPAGTNRLVLTRTGTLSGDVSVKSLELLESSAVSAYNSRVTADRASTAWLSKLPYGLMFQYGAWGFPNNVGSAKSLNQQAADFNVAAFVNMVKQSGASYVIWSISWWTYHMDAPLTSPNAIVTAAGGPTSPGLAATTDLIGNVASALHAQGIRFMLYYHTGDEDGDWWPYQDFPTSFSATGTGDRSTFFANWQRVLAEIGNRYGTNLDGFVFDDGCIYYPAAFEAFEASARSGNPNRLISWNGSVVGGLRYTDFQDLSFGEGSHGEATTGSAPVGGNGIFTSGPEVGLLQHSMFMMDGDWGVHTQGGNKISSGIESNESIGWVASASGRGVPLSFDLMMYEDGTVADSDLATLNDVRQSVFATTETIPTGTVLVNDNSSAITYIGSWSYSTNRGAGDFDNDVHYTATNGNSVSYTFTGTGVDVLGPKSSASGQFNVSVDGALIGTFSEFANTYTPQAVIYSARHLTPGTHTIQLVKESSTYFQIDAFRAVPNSVELNDTSTSIVYTGTWTYGNNRGAGDFDNDVHYTPNNGDSVSITFTGTGIDVIGPMSSADGSANVKLDGAQVSTITAVYSGTYTPQQHYWGIRNQTPGTHTLTLTKTGGNYLQIDAATIWP